MGAFFACCFVFKIAYMDERFAGLRVNLSASVTAVTLVVTIHVKKAYHTKVG